MPFPVSRSIIVALDTSWRGDVVLDDVERRLPALGATNVRRAPSTLAFGVPWSTTYGPLFIVTGGDFAIVTDGQSGRAHCLRCYLSFRRAAVMVAILSYGGLGIAASIFEGGYSGGSLAGTLFFCTIGYCWLLGIWYLIVPPWLVSRMQLLRFTRPPDVPVS
jgi:hypothetical protein